MTIEGHVTVAVVVLDRRVEMLRCLEAILVQEHPSFDVVVVDNGSTDGTPEAVRERARSAEVPVSVLSDPGSVGHLRRLASEVARGEFLAFTDSDCVPAPGWLRAGTAALEADPGLGLVQGCTLPETEPTSAWAKTQRITGPTRFFETCNIFYRLEALREADGFTDDIGWFCEDTAAGWSVVRLGWGHGYAADALVHHDVTYPGLPWHLRHALLYQEFAAVARKYPDIRGHLFWRRWFLSRRYAAFPAAVLGLAVGTRWRPALLLALPYVWFRRPTDLRWPSVRGQLEGTLYDSAAFAGLVRGSLRHRRIVL